MDGLWHLGSSLYTAMTAPLEEGKAQHYIPKFYLKGFADNQRRLWVYEKFKPIRESKPKHEAHRSDYYTHAEKGDRDETAEDVLKELESRAAPIIRKLANPQYVLTPENAAYLIMFTAFMFVRVPAWREHLDGIAVQIFRTNQLRKARDKEAFNASCVDFEKATGKSLGDFEEMRQYLLKDEYGLVQQSKAFNLGAMFTSGFKALDELKVMGYQALYAPEGKFFLSSDSPVYTIQPDGTGHVTVGMGFGWPNVEVYFPLNKRTCLGMKKGIEPKGWTAEPGRVDEINDLVMATATRYLYSSQRYKRTARLFDERGCEVQAGKNAFMLSPEPPKGISTRRR
jgi:hypothetical protein